ncbi:MAG: hypothetical protein WC637_23230 [Victivallales bacterium]
MKKLMLAGAVAFSMVCGVYTAVEVTAADKCCPSTAKKEAAVCEACAKLSKDVKPGEKAKLCDACTKKCEVKTDAKAPEAKK